MDLSTPASVFDGLDNNLEIPKLDEKLFIKYYLPFFNVPNPPQDAMTNLLHYHLSITDNPYVPIHVYRGKEFLFEVPPIYRDDTEERLNKFGKDNLSKILAEISLCQQAGSNMEAVSLSMLLENAVEEKVKISPKHVEQWKYIFKFYNIKPVQYDINGDVKPVNTMKDVVEEKEAEVNFLDEL